MRSVTLLFAVLASLVTGQSLATTRVPGGVPASEAVVIQETYRIVDEIGETIWPGFPAVPFPIVLVTEEHELLIGWEGALPGGFAEFDDPRLGPAAIRDRVFSPRLSAAFPAFGLPSVVVIGTMEATEKTPAQWALTLLHEHFHQLQYAGHDYQADVAGLDLAGDDTSGMWMLEYPFPYDDERVGGLFAELATALSRSLGGGGPTEAPWTALAELKAALALADRRYLSFQLWQEGVARFVELRAAEALAAGFEPGAEFLALGGFDSWRHEAEALRQRIAGALATSSLADEGRVAFYPVGAALAMALERRAPAWKERYERPRFALELYARPAVAAGVEITYLANEGFLLAAGDDKVLVDALFPGIDGYPRVPAAVRELLDRAAAPFDGVDAVLATHFHGDHFGAAEVARFLAASPSTVFVSTPDAVERLRRSAASGTGAQPAAREHYPAAGGRFVIEIDDDLRVTGLNLHHGRSRPEIQNLGFVVEIGGLKVLHVGDTEVEIPDIAAYDLASEEIDVALLPGWLLAEPPWRPVVDEIDARHVVVMHLAAPDAPASWFGSAGSLEGRIARIRELFPDAWIPTRALAARTYLPQP